MEENKKSLLSLITICDNAIKMAKANDTDSFIQEAKKNKCLFKNITVDSIIGPIKNLLNGISKSGNGNQQSQGENTNGEINKTNEAKNYRDMDLENIKIEVLADLISTEDKAYFGEVIASTYLDDEESIEALKELSTMSGSEIEDIARQACVRLREEGIIGSNETIPIPSGEIAAICSNAQNEIRQILKDYDLASQDEDYGSDEYDEETQQYEEQYEEEMK